MQGLNEFENISTVKVNDNPDLFYKDLEDVISKMEIMVDSYCGKCTPCRVGNKRLLEKLKKLRMGRVSKRSLEFIVDLSQKIIDSCLCLLGKNGPNMVLDLVRKYFI